MRFFETFLRKRGFCDTSFKRSLSTYNFGGKYSYSYISLQLGLKRSKRTCLSYFVLTKGTTGLKFLPYSYNCQDVTFLTKPHYGAIFLNLPYFKLVETSIFDIPKIFKSKEGRVYCDLLHYVQPFYPIKSFRTISVVNTCIYEGLLPFSFLSINLLRYSMENIRIGNKLGYFLNGRNRKNIFA